MQRKITYFIAYFQLLFLIVLWNEVFFVRNSFFSASCYV